MKLLPRGGYLATCSCSHFMKEDLFLKMLNEAASDAKSNTSSDRSTSAIS